MNNNVDINKISVDIVTDLAKSMAQTLYKKIVNYIVDLKNKDEVDFGYAYTEYLNYAKSIHEKIKTLLYRHVAKDIYSFYECVGLKRNKNKIDTSNVNNVLKIGNKLIITGIGGVGKSIMMKHFFLNVLKNTNYIPVLVELRGLNTFDAKNIDIVDYIFNVMKTQKFTLEKKYFDYSLETGNYVILLDGFDEVKNELSKTVTNQIFALSNKYPDNHYIVSSRPLEEFIGWNQFEELKSMSLSKKQALSLISKIDYDSNIKDKFYEELDKNLFVKYKTFASNPLLLTIMLLTYENGMSIPNKLNDFFEQAFTTLFHTHDSTKGGYKRDIRCKLGYEDFKVVFSYFCFKSFFKSEYKFSESKALEYITATKKKGLIESNFGALDFLKDLTNSVCMLVHEGLDYRFSHRAFQEYFAALYTTQLDDLQQKHFLALWLQDAYYRTTSNYLEMLYELQQNRFIKNVLIPGIKQLQELFKKNGESEEWLIDLLFTYIYVGKYPYKVETISVETNNLYYLTILNKVCNIGGFNKKLNEETKQRYKKQRSDLVEIIEENYSMNGIVYIKELKDKGYTNQILQAFGYVIDKYNFAVNYIESIDNESFSRKKKFLSMLNEL